ncbi:39S ribosomal protein L40, mitochondrial-like [Oppia nitens]|uniref:39S ribosomal protein L40, mitochondrial-like n=1 Tax=Oppia nitens TaxID=1686743 RepID=UPI0023DA97B7|nr:39S ribosomal protein L40, mitochondrial-like [Oppia nitens]
MIFLRMSSLILSLNKLFVSNAVHTRPIFTSACLMAEPMRKKKRIDPQLLKRREERKLRKLEKEIKRLEATPKQLKPIIELQLTPQVIKELEQRKRQEINDQSLQEWQRIHKLWSIYKCEQRLAEIKSITSMVKSQNNALKVLRNESEELYQSAISIDDNLIPFKTNNVKKETPKVEEYVPPDGKMNDITKQWAM